MKQLQQKCSKFNINLMHDITTPNNKTILSRLSQYHNVFFWFTEASCSLTGGYWYVGTTYCLTLWKQHWNTVTGIYTLHSKTESQYRRPQHKYISSGTDRYIKINKSRHNKLHLWTTLTWRFKHKFEVHPYKRIIGSWHSDDGPTGP
jgi:hypothetical protein